MGAQPLPRTPPRVWSRLVLQFPGSANCGHAPQMRASHGPRKPPEGVALPSTEVVASGVRQQGTLLAPVRIRGRCCWTIDATTTGR